MKPTNVIMFIPKVMMQPSHVIFIDLTYGILVISDSYGVPYNSIHYCLFRAEALH